MPMPGSLPTHRVIDQYTSDHSSRHKLAESLEVKAICGAVELGKQMLHSHSSIAAPRTKLLPEGQMLLELKTSVSMPRSILHANGIKACQAFGPTPSLFAQLLS
jgi:hypothetical protein